MLFADHSWSDVYQDLLPIFLARRASIRRTMQQAGAHSSIMIATRSSRLRVVCTLWGLGNRPKVVHDLPVA